MRFQVGLVFQYPEYQLFEETVYKDIAFGPGNMGLDKEEIDRRVRESARMVGLAEELLEKSPFDLSGGQKRRVAIAGVMAMEPKVLILDEPTAGLDPRGRDEILAPVSYTHLIGEAGRKGTLGSPYAIRDFRGINPEYGTLGDFMHLVGEIHKRGMKCIIDVVYNHTSPDSILATGHPEFFLRDEAGNPTRKVADWSDVVDLDYSCLLYTSRCV